MNLTRTKTIEQSIADTEATEGSEHQLRKELGAVQLTVFGVGVIIGTGIFVLTGEAAGVKAGPAVALSFVFSGLASRRTLHPWWPSVPWLRSATRSLRARCRWQARRELSGPGPRHPSGLPC